MRRTGNWLLWLGFATAVFAAFSYAAIFVRFPATRDFPWANLALFAVAGWLLGMGLYRAFARPERYRGRVSGPVLAVLSLAIFCLFAYGIIFAARNLPPAAAALRTGQRAPDFTLAGADGKPVSLSELLTGKRAVLLIFYRGYW
jgi:hypothetical protein